MPACTYLIGHSRPLLLYIVLYSVLFLMQGTFERQNSFITADSRILGENHN